MSEIEVNSYTGIKVNGYTGYTGIKGFAGFTPLHHTTIFEFPDGTKFDVSYNTEKSELIIIKNNREEIFCQVDDTGQIVTIR